MNGAQAEDQALAYLLARGLKLVARNYRCRGGELDLVLRDGETLVVAEVRQRSHRGFGGGAASIDRRKRGRLVLATQSFLLAHPHLARAPLRFDVVALDGAAGCDWIAGAFDGGDA